MSRQIQPVPGVSLKRAKGMSRQARYALKNKAAGKCPRCGREALAVKRNGKPASLGPKCLRAQRDLMHKRLGCKRRNKGALSYSVSVGHVRSSEPSIQTLPKPSKHVNDAAKCAKAGARSWSDTDDIILNDPAFSHRSAAKMLNVSEAAVRGRRQRIGFTNAKRRQEA